MLFYNLTIISESSIATRIIERLKQIQALSNKPFDLLQLLDSPHEGTTLSLQFKAIDQNELSTFKSTLSTPIQQAMAQDFPQGQVVFFESVMQYLS